MATEMLPAHKATIRRHLEESSAIPIEQVHRELMEIFSRKGKYSLPQITAVTSWLRSGKLQDRKINEPDWVEDFGETSEDIDYNTPAKINSREWHFDKLIFEVTEEQRKKMKVLLMPGRNTFDYQQALKSGLDPANLVTYMRGDVPAANAEYVRNAREFGVIHRRIGDLDKNLKDEQQNIHAAYLDFFGQFCQSYVNAGYQIPLDPNHYPINVTMNVMEGREHGKTSMMYRSLDGLAKASLQANTIIGDSKFFGHLNQGMKDGAESDEETADVRERAIIQKFYGGIGVANTKNWIAGDAIRKLIETNGDCPDYEETSATERFIIMDRKMKQVISLFNDTSYQFREQGTNLDMTLLGMGVRMAMVNTAQIRKVHPTEHYVSPNGNRPFVSFAATLETHRDYYLQYEDAIRFFLEIALDVLPCIKANTDFGTFENAGSGTEKKLLFKRANGKIVAQANIDRLREASFGLAKYQNAAAILGITEEQWNEMQQKRYIAAHRDSVKREAERTLSAMPGIALLGRIGNRQAFGGQVGRNEPCPCGSGKKFKKCCH